MQEDFFENEYYVPPNPQIVELVKKLIAWERKCLTLYPKDVMNMLVDEGAVTAHDIKKIVMEVENRPLYVTLPNNHLS